MDSFARKTLTWHTVSLPQATQKALNFLSKEKWLRMSSWYLAGGTALALQVGHRVSVDLDFFLPNNDFSTGRLVKHFHKSAWHTNIARDGTIYGRLLNAKVSFIAYPFFVPAQPFLHYGGIKVLSAHDIAVMKVIAISQRGRKRDFIDLFWYCKNIGSMDTVLYSITKQYPTVNHNYAHVYKSLIYFDDAEDDPMPKIFFKTSWSEIKNFFKKEVPKATKKVLRLA
ncbi:nucleotidyl transferase AbiEii/AbiGii toxin family protein [Candidatus Peregrinibacteria bacterium]|nr:nucleotidyl transferase AbiEii/AbiGii toxin family protein [Candidatus Peregrinibacteria bacterium]